MIAYQEPSMFSGRRGAALVAVALLHTVMVSAFYFGLARPIIEHFTAPVTIDIIPKSREKVVVPTAPKFDQRKLQFLRPEFAIIPTDPEPQLAIEPKRTEPPLSVEPAPAAHETVAATAARMDPKHPLHIGPDYYPDGAIRRGQEGRCVVQVAVAADGRIISSALQASSGFPSLDDACLSAVRGQHMLPATQNGKAIESNVSLPIVWQLTGSR
jgi:periplasmic protein TonB